MNNFLELTAKRRSCRAFDPEREISDAALDYCLQSAGRAPSACNRQPWRFMLVQNSDMRKKIIDEGLLPGIKHDWLHTAPCIVVLYVAVETITHRLAPLFSRVPYQFVDAGIAGEHFILAAAEQGLGTCWVGWIREKQLKSLLSIPKKHRLVALIPAGYPVDPCHFDSPAPTSRKAIDDISQRR